MSAPRPSAPAPLTKYRVLCPTCGLDRQVWTEDDVLDTCITCKGEDLAGYLASEVELMIAGLQQQVMSKEMSPTFAASLCATLKKECEVQHARAEQAEATVATLTAQLEAKDERIGYYLREIQALGVKLAAVRAAGVSQRQADEIISPFTDRANKLALGISDEDVPAQVRAAGVSPTRLSQQEIYDSVKESVRAEFHAIAEKNRELIEENAQLRTGDVHDYYRNLIDRMAKDIATLRAAGVSPPAMDRYRKILTAMKTTAADLRDPETNGGDANTQAAEVLLGFRRELADLIHPDLAPLFAKTAVRAAGVSPRSATACINCGEAEDGGYETSNGGEVGPLCSTCWEAMREEFQEVYYRHDEDCATQRSVTTLLLQCDCSLPERLAVRAGGVSPRQVEQWCPVCRVSYVGARCDSWDADHEVAARAGADVSRPQPEMCPETNQGLSPLPHSYRCEYCQRPLPDPPQEPK